MLEQSKAEHEWGCTMYISEIHRKLGVRAP